MLTNSAKLGSYLVDKDGNTLYYYGLDVNGSTSSCLGGCLAVWPIYYEANVKVGPGLNAADFTAGQTAGGQKQTYYKGWPLYYYAAPTNGQFVRESAGATSGEGIGGDWFVARPDYSVMVAKGAVVDKATNTRATKLYLMDTQGHTLYTYAKDSRLPSTKESNCQGGCATEWPVFYQAKITAPSSLAASDFGTITRPDGPNGTTRPQTTYKGMPLYYHSGDGAVPGKTTGETSGGPDAWTVAAP